MFDNVVSIEYNCVNDNAVISAEISESEAAEEPHTHAYTNVVDY